MAYATPADLLKRYDARTLGDLAGDTGVRVSSVALLTDPNVEAALDDATGQINASVLRAGRYQVADLAALTGDVAAYLIRITCDIALANLWHRRPYADNDGRTDALDRAERHLKELREGQAVFNIAENIEMGNPTTGGPTLVELRRLNLLRDRTQNFYPLRHLPDNR